MSARTPGLGDTGGYAIRTQGRIDERWSEWFEGVTLAHEADGTTVIRGRVADQAALHGLIQKVRDIGLPLVSVTTGPTTTSRKARP